MVKSTLKLVPLAELLEQVASSGPWGGGSVIIVNTLTSCQLAQKCLGGSKLLPNALAATLLEVTNQLYIILASEIDAVSAWLNHIEGASAHLNDALLSYIRLISPLPERLALITPLIKKAYQIDWHIATSMVTHCLNLAEALIKSNTGGN